jgi:hypothetical protein
VNDSIQTDIITIGVYANTLTQQLNNTNKAASITIQCIFIFPDSKCSKSKPKKECWIADARSRQHSAGRADQSNRFVARVTGGANEVVLHESMQRVPQLLRRYLL